MGQDINSRSSQKEGLKILKTDTIRTQKKKWLMPSIFAA